MRVLHVSATNQLRGAEVFLADLIDALSDATDHAVVYLRASTGAPVTFPCQSRELRGNGQGLALIASLLDARRAVRRFDPDVIQVHGGEALRLAVLAGLAKLRPIVYRRIGGAPDTIRAGWRRRWHRWLMHRATIVICVAEAVRAESIELFQLSADQTIMIPNTVNATRLEGRDRTREEARVVLDLPSEAQVILSLGALTWEKDPLDALEITAPLLAAHNSLLHVFVGDGDLHDELRMKADSLGVSSRVLIQHARQDIGTVLAAADVVLFTSRPDGMEGLPATVIEAGLTGRPVVARAVAGVDEAVVDGVTGLLAPPGDVDLMRSHVTRLLGDADRAHMIGTTAQQRCETLYVMSVAAPAYLTAWQRVAHRAA
jgi:glycosyltransferase involved in cell wall biosynthesis